MRKVLFIIVSIFISCTCFSQINLEDSTVQVIGYWDKKEKQVYKVVETEYKIKDEDTTSVDVLKYTVDITIVDSTADSYVMDWHYKDYEVQTENSLLMKLSKLNDNTSVRIRTDEFGAFQEVVNWKEVRNNLLKATRLLKKEMKKIPEMKKFIDQIENLYGTKESIETAVAKDIQQFLTFHGGIYEFHEEYKASMKLPNIYGGEPFDSDVTVWVDEVNADDNNFVIRMEQVVDKQQLIAATMKFLNEMSGTLKIVAPQDDLLQDMSNNTWLATRIHGSGWVVYSIQTTEVKVPTQTKIKERVIEIQ